MLKIQQTFFIIIFTLFTYNCSTPSTEKKLCTLSKNVGKNEIFIIKRYNVGIKITLNTNFNFTHEFFSYGCTGGFIIKKVLGNYKIDSNEIYFKPKKMIWIEDRINHLDNSNLKFDTIPYYESDSTSIQKKYWLLKQKKIKFLISELKPNEKGELFMFKSSSNFISLAKLYNSNKKQHTSKNLLSNKDTLWNFKKLNLNKNIPQSYRNLFIDSFPLPSNKNN